MTLLPADLLMPLMSRLSRASLSAVRPRVRRPRFDPADLRPGILHLGCGSFHRAHQALLTQIAIEDEMGTHARLPAWGIAAVSLCTPAVVQALAEQDALYTVIEHRAGHISATVVGAIRQCFYHPAQPQLLPRVFADPTIRIVTLTITAGGYCMDTASDALDHGQPAIMEDLRLAHPRTALGVLVAGLQQRRDVGMAPPVVLSCDNLPSNGRMLRQMCIDYAALKSDRLSGWIADHVQFPSTMVDRIVPATRPCDLDDARAALGLLDAVPVPAEPFHQWVIETFDGPRPRWEAAGAEYVADVGPWEASKLRLLNGGHLAIACLGLLAGCTTVAEVMALPYFDQYVHRFLVAEQKPTLPPSGHDIDAYARQLLKRFRNHGISHGLDRIARDSSAKLAPRLLDPLRENRRAGRAAPCTVLALAAWMCWATSVRAATTGTAMQNSLGARLCRCGSEAAGDPDRFVTRLLSFKDVFGDDLPRDSELHDDLCNAVRALHQLGAQGAVATCMTEESFFCETPAPVA